MRDKTNVLGGRRWWGELVEPRGRGGLLGHYCVGALLVEVELAVVADRGLPAGRLMS